MPLTYDQIWLERPVLCYGVLHRDSYGNGPGMKCDGMKCFVSIKVDDRDRAFPINVGTSDTQYLGWVRPDDLESLQDLDDSDAKISEHIEQVQETSEESESKDAVTVNATKGIDVSNHQEDIDWQAVKSSGVEFAMIRCGFRYIKGRNMEEDKRFEKNVLNAKNDGVKIGTYFYGVAHSVAEAEAEADFCLSLIKKFPPQWFEYPVVYDIEDDSMVSATGDDKDTLTNMVHAFCGKIEAAGYYTSFYANPNWLNNHLHGNELMKKYDLWLAHWGVDSPSRPCGLWQYTSKGSVPGIIGNVDMDWAYCDYPDRIKSLHYNGF